MTRQARESVKCECARELYAHPILQQLMMLPFPVRLAARNLVWSNLSRQVTKSTTGHSDVL